MPRHRPILHRNLKSFEIDKLLALLRQHGVDLFWRSLERYDRFFEGGICVCLLDCDRNMEAKMAKKNSLAILL